MEKSGELRSVRARNGKVDAYSFSRSPFFPISADSVLHKRAEIYSRNASNRATETRKPSVPPPRCSRPPTPASAKSTGTIINCTGSREARSHPFRGPPARWTTATSLPAREFVIYFPFAEAASPFSLYLSLSSPRAALRFAGVGNDRSLLLATDAGSFLQWIFDYPLASGVARISLEPAALGLGFFGFKPRVVKLSLRRGASEPGTGTEAC